MSSGCQRTSAILSLMLSCSAVLSAAFANGRLDRASAEKLLRTQVGALQLGEDPVVVALPTSLPVKDGGNEEDRFTIQFMDVLTSAGLLRNKQEIPNPFGELQVTLMGAKLFERYEPAPQDFVEVIEPRTPREQISLTLASPAITKVTGVASQPGAIEAEVEAEVEVVPTPLYKRLESQVRPLLSRCSTFPVPTLGSKPKPCDEWPTVSQLAATRSSRLFLLKKFDDGWRVESERRD